MPDQSLLLQFAGAPAPMDVVEAVQSVEVERAVDIASVFSIRLGIHPSLIGDWTLLEMDYFRPLLPLTIRISDGLGIPNALINGYVTRQRVEYSEDPSCSVLEVQGSDATALMNLQEKVMPWPNMPASAIAAAIFPQYGLIPRVDPTTPQYMEPEGTTTQRGTDIRFLRRLARELGFECYVQPEPLTGLDQGFFQAPGLTPGLPDAVINVNMGQETNVADFRIDYDMTRPTGAMATGLDVATKAPQPALAPVSTRFPMGIEPTLLRVLPPSLIRVADTGLMSTSELQSAVQAIADESSMAVVAEGSVTGDVGVLRPGGIVNIRGLGRVLTGSYYVTRVAHAITRDGGHTQRFQARRNAVTMTGAELFLDPGAAL